jgi:hypothetical protein
MQESEPRWKMLAELASNEKDPDKLLKLIQEINRLIDEKRGRFTEEPSRE